MMSRSAVIVCPLRREQQFIARHLRRAGIDNVTTSCCGPGADGIRRWTERTVLPDESVVLLAGLAGGLSARATAGTAWTIAGVIGDDDTTFAPTRAGASNDATVVSAGSILATVEDKRALHARTRADLVDLESATFATVATAQRWDWGIIRGVSDDARTPLPPALATWVTPTGRTRPSRVALSVARRPELLASIAQLRTTSARALAAVSLHVQVLLDEP